MSNRQLSDELCEKAFDFSVDDNYTEALECYNKAIEADPTNPKAYIGRAETYMDMAKDDDEYVIAHNRGISDYTIAIQYLTDAKERSEALSERAASYAIIGDPDKVITDCIEAIKLDPENQQAYYWRADAYWDKEKYREAFPDYQKAADLGNAKAVEVLKEKYNWIHGMSAGDNMKARLGFGKSSGSDDSGTEQTGPKTPILIKLAGTVVGGLLLLVFMFPFGLIVGAACGWFLSGFVWKILKNILKK